ncbi:SH3 domain-containing protein [Synechocystis salina LEGE 06099]|uniref:SH3 domain-containing protein n=1 Tax=Synechocystis salina TaxID=945780 RepID=UPI0018802019|nr:SH3 domain-containing protein [Synechocystis salina]MBE9203588.1 SH3 domain-containing protein [Synechocystis salina LEGE 06099]
MSFRLAPTFVLSLALVVLTAEVQAKQICKVTDPTGTPLNVRNSPNSKIINSLRNGREVEILETDYDNRGRPWVRIGGNYRGEYRFWGWVIREFISCYDR